MCFDMNVFIILRMILASFYVSYDCISFLNDSSYYEDKDKEIYDDGTTETGDLIMNKQFMCGDGGIYAG